MKTAKIKHSEAGWAPQSGRGRKRDGARKTSAKAVDIIALIAEYRQAEETLSIEIDRQEAAAGFYFYRGYIAETDARTDGFDPDIKPVNPRPKVKPIRTRDAGFIEDINDAEFSIVALTAKLEILENQVLSADPKTGDEARAKIRFIFSRLIADEEMEEKFPKQMIERCLSAIA